jgi:phosphate transport system substrate-binding protein
VRNVFGGTVWRWFELHVWVAALFALCFSLAPRQGLAGGTGPPPMVFAGSGSNLPITRVLAEAYVRTHPGVGIELPKSLGSTGGIRAAAEGAITVALISRPLRDKEVGYGLTVVPYARTPLVLGAHPSVPDDGLTGDELIQIIQGTKSRWRDGKEIIVFLLYPEDSLTEELVSKVPGLKQPYMASYEGKRWTFLYTDQLMNERIPRTPGALGVITLGAVLTERLPIKPLAFNGIAPTLENLQNGRYPLALTLAFAFKSDALPAPASAFLAFVQSAGGEQVLRTHGYLAVR